MVANPVVDQDDVTLVNVEDFGQEVSVAVGVEALLVALEVEIPRHEVNQTEDLVSATGATGFDRGLLSFAGPGVGERPPLSEGSLIPEEDPRSLGFGQSDNLRPESLLPLLASPFALVIRNETRLLEAEAQFSEQLTDVMGMVEHPKAPLDEVCDHHATPAARDEAALFRPSFNQLGQTLALRLGQLRWPAPARLGSQALGTLEQIGSNRISHSLLTHAQRRSHLGHRQVLVEEQQRTNPLGNLPSPTSSRCIELVEQFLACWPAEPYPQLHESPPPTLNFSFPAQGWHGSRFSFHPSNPFKLRLFF